MTKQQDRGLIFAILFLIVGLLLLFFPFYILNGLNLFGLEIQINRYGELGAFISGVSAPFLSISAFTLLYLTYKSQKEELADSKLILKQQNATLEKQQFETTFFNLLNLHHSIVNNIDIVIKASYGMDGTKYSDGETKKGRDCFLTFYAGLKTAYRKPKKQVFVDQIDNMNYSYHLFFEKHKYDLGHYFSNLYHIVKFVHNSKIKDKQQYISLLRAQLSTHELLMLFYNGLSAYGTKFKPLIEEYHLLKNIPINDLISSDHLKEYNNSAYTKETHE